MLLFLGTFDVHRRDWRALLRRMRLLRLAHKRQKTLVLRMKWQKTIELRKKAQCNPPLSPCQLKSFSVSKLFRNVPFLTSLKMSPFFCSASFSFLGSFSRKSSRQEAPGTTIPISLDLRHPSVLLAWSGAQPCEARRAERLGRSGGPGQRRARRGGGQLGGALLHLAADRLMPRMVCRRRPLPFLD
jgi:hypothetical protein